MKLTPFLLFDGHCAEAMAFYQACLGGELTITRVGNTPMKDRAPPSQHAKVAYGHLADRYGVHWFFQGGGSAEQPGQGKS